MKLEQSKRMSESMLWELQTAAYTQFGPDAWATKGVPFYLTSNPLIAKQFAHVILGYLRDCLSPEALTPLVPEEPVYIFDLGAGSGKLGYLCLKHLLSLVDTLFPRKLKLKYVMTDISADNITFWQNHSYLEPFIKRGALDFAFYQHAQTEPIQLLQSQHTLTSVKNPIILVCTYYFDTIPQDLFRTKDGKIEEGRISLEVPDGRTWKDKWDPALIGELNASYDYIPITQPLNYYEGRPDLNALLQNYVGLTDATPFLFPIGGFQSLDYFSHLSNGRLLLLAGDQGVCTEEQILVWGEPKISKHATFSIGVNYHAIAQYFRQQGGFGWLTRFSDPKFVVIGAGLGGDEKHFPEAHLAFCDHLEAFEPVHYWKLTNLSDEALELLTLDQLVALIQLGNWDPINFYTYFGAIRKKLGNASDSAKKTLSRVILQVAENFYPVDRKEGHFLMNLGLLQFEIEHYAEALLFFKKALELLGEERDLLINIAKCYRLLGDQSSALLYLHKAAIGTRDLRDLRDTSDKG